MGQPVKYIEIFATKARFGGTKLRLKKQQRKNMLLGSKRNSEKNIAKKEQPQKHSVSAAVPH